MKRNEDINIKEKIVVAYIKLCYRYSIVTVTLQMIADEAGVAFSTVRYYFAKEKFSLERAAIEYCFDVAYEFNNKYSLAARDKTDYNPLLNYIESSFLFEEKYPELFSFTMHFYYLLSTQVSFLKNNEDYLNIAIKRIQSLIYESIGRGYYSNSSVIEKKAKQIHTILFGNLLLTFTIPSKKSEYNERLSHTKALIALILNS